MRAGLRAVPVTAGHSSESPRGTLRNKIYYLQVLKGTPHPRGHTVRVWRFAGQRRGGEREGERKREQGLGALPLWGRAGRPGFPGLTLYRTIYNTKARGGAGGKSEGLTGRVRPPRASGAGTFCMDPALLSGCSALSCVTQQATCSSEMEGFGVGAAAGRDLRTGPYATRVRAFGTRR